jgi:glycine cleavage system H protein
MRTLLRWWLRQWGGREKVPGTSCAPGASARSAAMTGGHVRRPMHAEVAMSDEFLQVMVGKFVFRVKPGVFYTEAGVWVAHNVGAGLVRVGLTDFRQQSSGDAAFVELPAPGTRVVAGEDLADVETIKVDLAVQSPFEGEVIAVNEALVDAPELINQDPYGAGWLVDLRPATWPAPGLLNADAYLALMTAQAEEASR